MSEDPELRARIEARVAARRAEDFAGRPAEHRQVPEPADELPIATEPVLAAVTPQSVPSGPSSDPAAAREPLGSRPSRAPIGVALVLAGVVVVRRVRSRRR